MFYLYGKINNQGDNKWELAVKYSTEKLSLSKLVKLAGNKERKEQFSVPLTTAMVFSTVKLSLLKLLKLTGSIEQMELLSVPLKTVFSTLNLFNDCLNI